jgi:hypothetical protein
VAFGYALLLVSSDCNIPIVHAASPLPLHSGRITSERGLAIGRSVEMFAVLLRAAAQTLYKSGYKDSKNPGGNLSARPPRRYQYKRLASGSVEDTVWAITRLARRGRRAEEPPRLSSTTHYILLELGRPLITVFMSSCKRVYRRMPVAGHPFCYTVRRRCLAVQGAGKASPPPNLFPCGTSDGAGTVLFVHLVVEP